MCHLHRVRHFQFLQRYWSKYLHIFHTYWGSWMATSWSLRGASTGFFAEIVDILFIDLDLVTTQRLASARPTASGVERERQSFGLVTFQRLASAGTTASGKERARHCSTCCTSSEGCPDKIKRNKDPSGQFSQETWSI